MCLDVINQTWTALYGEFGHGILFGDIEMTLPQKNVAWLFFSYVVLGMGKNFEGLSGKVCLMGKKMGWAVGLGTLLSG